MPALRGKTVVSLFYEDSTRTRLSFETAAKRLSADTMTFSVSTSSVQEGREPARHRADDRGDGHRRDRRAARARAGAPHRVAAWIDASVVNAGDGRHEHPTQALLDAFTLRRHRGPSLDGCRVAIVGDIRNSRVARSDVKAFARARLRASRSSARRRCMPERLDGWPVTVTHDLDDVLPDVDVVYLLRIQRERIGQALFPSLREYTRALGPHRRARRAARSPTRS